MASKTKITTTNPHDQFFHQMMADIKVRESYLRNYLPKDIVNRIDYNNLEIQERKNYNKIGNQYEVDLLIKTTIDGQGVYLYLLVEHQSRKDNKMAFRILQYTVNIIDYHLKKYKTDKIPLVYPMVLYHGRKKYTDSTDIKDFVDAPKDLVEKYFLRPFQLIDLNVIEDEKLREQAHAGVMGYVFKHVFEHNFLPKFQALAKILNEWQNTGDRNLMFVVLKYISENCGFNDEQEFFQVIGDEISHDAEVDMRTVAQQLRNEGWREGKVEGKLETAKNLLDLGSDPEFIVQATGLSFELIQGLKKEKKN